MLAETAGPIPIGLNTLPPPRKELIWRGEIRGEQWEVRMAMANLGFFYVRMLPTSKWKMPRRLVKMGDNDKWVSECACSFGNEPCIHIDAAKAAYEYWKVEGFIPIEKKTDDTLIVSVIEKEPDDASKETEVYIENKVAASLGLDNAVDYVFGLDESSEESKTVVGELRNSIFSYVLKSGPFFPKTYTETYPDTYSEEPNVSEEILDQAEPAEPLPLQEPEELPDPPKAKNRFSEMEI